MVTPRPVGGERETPCPGRPDGDPGDLDLAPGTADGRSGASEWPEHPADDPLLHIDLAEMPAIDSDATAAVRTRQASRVQSPAQQSATQGVRTSITPKALATPLPPRKRCQAG